MAQRLRNQDLVLSLAVFPQLRDVGRDTGIEPLLALVHSSQRAPEYPRPDRHEQTDDQVGRRGRPVIPKYLEREDDDNQGCVIRSVGTTLSRRRGFAAELAYILQTEEAMGAIGGRV